MHEQEQPLPLEQEIASWLAEHRHLLAGMPRGRLIVDWGEESITYELTSHDRRRLAKQPAA